MNEKHFSWKTNVRFARLKLRFSQISVISQIIFFIPWLSKFSEKNKRCEMKKQQQQDDS